MRVITYEDVLNAARHGFLSTGTVDAKTLTKDLSVSRATLYRVVGNHDRLLGDVLWQLAERTLELAVTAAVDLKGIERMLAISRHFEAEIASFKPLQQLVRSDPLRASRVLFTPAGAVHQRLVEAWTELFREAVASGELELLAKPEEFAYLYVRLGESLLHSDLLAGIATDSTTADRIRRAIFLQA